MQKAMYPEYSLPEMNKDVGRIREKRECGQVKQLRRSVEYKGKKVHVTLEFPMEADGKAQNEFDNMLKEMYMYKIKSELDKKA